jgi:hypothetical protein
MTASHGVPVTRQLTLEGRRILFQEMAAITRATGNEVALYQRTDGVVAMVMGLPDTVPVPKNVQAIIGHTHPSGMLGLSRDLAEVRPGVHVKVGDVARLDSLHQDRTWVIGPDGTAVQFYVHDWDQPAKAL